MRSQGNYVFLSLTHRHCVVIYTLCEVFVLSPGTQPNSPFLEYWDNSTKPWKTVTSAGRYLFVFMTIATGFNPEMEFCYSPSGGGKIILKMTIDDFQWKCAIIQHPMSMYRSESTNETSATLTPAWICYHMANKVWDDLTYQFPNVNGWSDM